MGGTEIEVFDWEFASIGKMQLEGVLSMEEIRFCRNGVNFLVRNSWNEWSSFGVISNGFGKPKFEKFGPIGIPFQKIESLHLNDNSAFFTAILHNKAVIVGNLAHQTPLHIVHNLPIKKAIKLTFCDSPFGFYFVQEKKELATFKMSGELISTVFLELEIEDCVVFRTKTGFQRCAVISADKLTMEMFSLPFLKSKHKFSSKIGPIISAKVTIEHQLVVIGRHGLQIDFLG